MQALRLNQVETAYDEKQIQDAKQLCKIMQAVPMEKQNIFLVLLNAYMDGLAAGAALAEKQEKSVRAQRGRRQ